MLSLLCLKHEFYNRCYGIQTLNVGNLKDALQHQKRAADIDVTNIFSKSVNKLMKGEALRKHSLHEKTAASVLLKLFICSNKT